MGATPVFGWPFPDLSTAPPDGPEAFEDLALAVESTAVGGPATLPSYTPAWTSTGSVQPSLPGVSQGYYRIVNDVCDLAIYFGFNASTIGGRGQLRFSLPVAASPDVGEQFLFCRLSTGAGTWAGDGVIFAGSSIVQPLFPRSATVMHTTYWQSADSTGAVGTGIPAVAGQLTVVNGGSIVIAGQYVV